MSSIRVKYPPQWGIGDKTCCACGKTFPRDPQYWNKSQNARDGLNCRCKKCRREYAAKWMRDHKGAPTDRAQGRDRPLLKDMVDLLHVATMTDEEMAAELGVGARSIERSRGRIREKGYPLVAVSESDVIGRRGAASMYWRILYPAGRTCPCGTILNRYNRGPLCGPCARSGK